MKTILKCLAALLLSAPAFAGVHVQQGDPGITIGSVTMTTAGLTFPDKTVQNTAAGSGSFSGINTSGSPLLSNTATIIPGSGMTITQSGSSITFVSAGGSGSFTGLNSSGNSNLASSATFVGGSGVTLSQSGSTITITASAGGLTGPASDVVFMGVGSTPTFDASFTYSSTTKTMVIQAPTFSGASSSYTSFITTGPIYSPGPGICYYHNIMSEYQNYTFGSTFDGNIGYYFNGGAGGCPSTTTNPSGWIITDAANNIEAQFTSGDKILLNYPVTTPQITVSTLTAVSSMTVQNITINGTCTGAGCGGGVTTSSTNTWTAQQTFNNQITISTSIIDGTGSVGTSGQVLSSQGSGQPVKWVAQTGGGGGAGGGVINASPQYDMTFYSASGSTTTVSGSSGVYTDATQSNLTVTGKFSVGTSTQIAGQIILGQAPDSTVSSTTTGISTLWASSSSNTLVFVQNGGTTVSTYTVVGSSSTPTVGHLAAWSTQGTLIDGGTGAGGGVTSVTGNNGIISTGGTTPNISVSSISLSTQVVGNLPASQIAAGTLGNTVIASSAAVMTIGNAQIIPGTFNGITIPSANISAGTLGGNVIASSVAVATVGPLQTTGLPLLTTTNTWTADQIFNNFVQFNSSVTAVSTVTLSNELYMSTGAIIGYDAQQNGTYVAIATITWNNGNIQESSVTANTTFNFIAPSTTTTRGASAFPLHLIIDIGGAGNFTASWPSNVDWGATGYQAISTTSGKRDHVFCWWMEKQNKYDCMDSGAQGF